MNSKYKLLLDQFLPAIFQEPNLVANNMVQLILPRISSEQVVDICENVKKKFIEEPSILDLHSPITIIGDIHGHILDLFRILNKFGMPPRRKYLFLGDLVDRGEFSIETVIIVFLLKIIYPKNVFLIRGNHEFSFLCQQSGFFNEVIDFYCEPSVFNACINTFSYIPLAAKIDGSYLCLHGGIGSNFTSLDSFKTLRRPIKDYDSECFIDSVLWSDPTNKTEYYAPSTRGSGYLFGASAVSEFCEKNDIKMIIRGHECVKEGAEFWFDNKLVTIFSASNYCGYENNKSAILEISSSGNYQVHSYPPLPMLSRSNVFFGVKPPPNPPVSPPRPHSFSRIPNFVKTPNPKETRPLPMKVPDRINTCVTYNAFPALSFPETIPLISTKFGQKKPGLIRPGAVSPRARRKSNIY